ncbi:MAG: hypothetical protein LWX56_06165 [Ignavibacteria bacterium]|nr:hypothetical protein [Ignavibacteria bacterium]
MDNREYCKLHKIKHAYKKITSVGGTKEIITVIFSWIVIFIKNPARLAHCYAGAGSWKYIVPPFMQNPGMSSYNISGVVRTINYHTYIQQAHV